jgi:uncharacterized protein (TIGR02001 family)
MSKKQLIAASVVAFVALPTFAEDAPKPPEPPKAPYTLSANVFLVSDYLFRGITQTWGKPAIQGGFDFVHDSGIYLGTWGSNVSSNEFPGGSMEWDLYGGYNYKLNDDVTLGAGVLYYFYPGANLDKANPALASRSLNTFEGNLSGSWKWIGVKLSYAFTDYFGADKELGFKDDTKGTIYPEVNVNYPLMDNLTLVGHVGYTHYAEKLAAPNVNGKDDPSYVDWKLGVSWVWKDGWTLGAYYVDTSNKDYYKKTVSFVNSDIKDLARATGYITVGRTF